MLRKFAAALIATALIAGPALAASPSDANGSTSATTNAQAPATTASKPATKPAKVVSHVRKHGHKHFVRHQLRKHKLVRHVQPVKHRIARHHATTAKFGSVKTNKTINSNKG